MISHDSKIKLKSNEDIKIDESPLFDIYYNRIN